MCLANRSGCNSIRTGSKLTRVIKPDRVSRARGCEMNLRGTLRAGPNCARPSHTSPFLLYPSGRGLKEPVGGLPHSGRIEGALLHRAPSASTGAPTHRLAPHTGHSSSFHAISQNIHSYRELITKASSIRRLSSSFSAASRQTQVGVEHESVPIRMMFLWRVLFQEILPDDTIDPGAGLIA